MSPNRSFSSGFSSAHWGWQNGFSLIELMISITIGLGILAGLIGVLATNSNNSRTNDRTSELMTNGRYALNSMKYELRQAGFRGYTWYADFATPATPAAMGQIVNECLETGAAAGQFVANMRQGIWGADNINPFSASCIPDASYAAGNDVLVVRRATATAVADADLGANGVYFRSTYERGQMFRGSTPPAWSGPPVPLASFQMSTYVYFVSPFTVSAAERPLVPALRRISLNPGGATNPVMASELVASGIEHMQVQYGVLTTAPATQYLDSVSGASFASGFTDWESVRSVRIWILARNANPEPGYSNTNVYVMGNQTYDFSAAPDNYRRQLFTTVVQLRN